MDAPIMSDNHAAVEQQPLFDSSRSYLGAQYLEEFLVRDAIIAHKFVFKYSGNRNTDEEFVPDEDFLYMNKTKSSVGYSFIYQKRSLVGVSFDKIVKRVSIEVYAISMEIAEEDCKWFLERFPKIPVKETELYVTFRAMDPKGDSSTFSRKLLAPDWQEIAPNYNTKEIEQIEYMIGENFKPGEGGKLLLWTGPAGTGKTTCLRAVAKAWKDWCDIEYICDTDNFFNVPNYMIQSILHKSDDDKWRLLVFEDSGELLLKDAKIRNPGLSRFLNIVDGFIGQGLKLMVLITTNEDIGALHEAIARPGRCALNIKFENLTPSVADIWRDYHGLEKKEESASLAELYGELQGFSGANEQKRSIGF